MSFAMTHWFLMYVVIWLAAAALCLAAKEDASLKVSVVDWVRSHGGYFNSKQEYRHSNPDDPTSHLGVFATERIESGEMLLSIPWKCIITDQENDLKDSMQCNSVRILIEELKKAQDSFYAPHVLYLLGQRKGQLPSFWSDAGKDLVEAITAYEELPPKKIAKWQHQWEDYCHGGDDPLEIFAASLMITHGEDGLMVPLYTWYNHRNGQWCNMHYNLHMLEKVEAFATATIEKGDEIFSSYNLCERCDGHRDTHGTPEIFRDYGFVEPMPQRWLFHNQGFKFDINERDGILQVFWYDNAEESVETYRFLRNELWRLKHAIEPRLRSAASTKTVPQHEMDVILQYFKALTSALTAAFEDSDVSEDQVPCEGGRDESGACIPDYGYEYDELSQLAEKEESTATCDNTDLIEDSGEDYVVVEDAGSFYQPFTFTYSEERNDKCLDFGFRTHVCSSFRPHYSEYMTHLAKRYIGNLRRVVFVGAGDSMILHELLKYPDIELVVGVELDQEVVRKVFEHFKTQPHFDDERVQWWFGDVAEFLSVLPKDDYGSFDLVIVNPSDAVMQLTGGLDDVLQKLALLLNEDGIFVTSQEHFSELSNLFDFTTSVYVSDVPMVCDRFLAMGSNRIDFLHPDTDTLLKHDGVETLVLEPFNDTNDVVKLVRDYQKNPATPGQCKEISDTVEEEQSLGLIMILEAENTTKPLEWGTLEGSVKSALVKIGLTPLATLANASDTGGIFGFFVMREGLVAARTWPKKNYCAFDIHLWGALAKMDSVRIAIADAVGSSKGSQSSYRIVSGGMFGVKTWREDQRAIGPGDLAQSRKCAEGVRNTKETVSIDQSETDIVLEECLKLIDDQDQDVVVVAVVCGKRNEPCMSRDFLERSSSVHEVITLWTCPNLDTAPHPDSIPMADCEIDVLDLLRGSVKRTGELSAFVLDVSAPFAMFRIADRIWRKERNQERLLMSDSAFIAITLERTETWRRDFLNRCRRYIEYEMANEAEVSLVGPESSFDVGVVTTGDSSFLTHFLDMTKSMERRTGLKAEIHKIETPPAQFQDDYDPKWFTMDDYDRHDGENQYSSQQALAAQLIVTVEVDQETVSSASLKHIFDRIPALTDFSTHVYDEVGDGTVLIGVSSQSSVIVIWDGGTYIDINVFTSDTSDPSDTSTLVDHFTEELENAETIYSNLQPRGIGRVVNFKSGGTEDTESKDGATSGALFECPTDVKKAKVDVADYFAWFDEYIEAAKRDLEGFRDRKFGGRSETYNKGKKMRRAFKSQVFGDNLNSGDIIYESACGDGFNLLLTLEILKEEKGIENITVYGNDYLADSVAIASALFDMEMPASKGILCRADSTNLSYVPSGVFDLAYSGFIDPLCDPLMLADESVPALDRYELSKERCKSDDPAVQKISKAEQQTQEDWYASFVTELVRIVKPGKIVVVEDLTGPICDKDSDWGGVSEEWWEKAITTYGWDIDPKSIEIHRPKWYYNAYNVVMRRNKPAADDRDEL